MKETHVSCKDCMSMEIKKAKSIDANGIIGNNVSESFCSLKRISCPDGLHICTKYHKMKKKGEKRWYRVIMSCYPITYDIEAVSEDAAIQKAEKKYEMDRKISADEVNITEISEDEDVPTEVRKGGHGSTDNIENKRNIVVKEVILCKDCKNYREAHYEKDGERPYIKGKCSVQTKYQVNPNSYCWLAEFKEEEVKE